VGIKEKKGKKRGEEGREKKRAREGKAGAAHTDQLSKVGVNARESRLNGST